MSDAPGFWRSAFTAADNVSVDIGRINWTLCIVAVLFFEGWSVMVRGQAFDAMGFAGACGVALTAGGGALLLKKSTEPKP